MVKNLLQCGRPGFDPWIWKITWKRTWKSTLVFLPGEFHGQMSLVGYSPWGRKELDMTWQLTLHFTTSAKPPYLVSRTDSGSNPNIYCTGLENQYPLFCVLSTFIWHTDTISIKREGHCHSYANPQAYVLPSKIDCMLLKPRSTSYCYIFLILFAPLQTSIW